MPTLSETVGGEVHNEHADLGGGLLEGSVENIRF